MALQNPPAPVPQTPANSLLPALATGLTEQDRQHIEDALAPAFPTTPKPHIASARRSFDERTQACSVPLMPVKPEMVTAFGSLVMVTNPRLEYLKYDFLPGVNKPGFPATPSATNGGNLQPWL